MYAISFKRNYDGNMYVFPMLIHISHIISFELNFIYLCVLQWMNGKKLMDL